MAIIITPKGWAIELEPVHAGNGQPDAATCAGHYEATVKSLLNTIQVAQSESEFLETPDYYSFALLEAMLPTYENAKAMFEDLFNAAKKV